MAEFITSYAEKSRKKWIITAGADHWEGEKGHHCYRPFVRGRSLGHMHVNA